MRKRNKKFICVQTRVGCCAFFAGNQGRSSDPLTSGQFAELIWRLLTKPVEYPDGTKKHGEEAPLAIANALVGYLSNPPVMPCDERTAVDLRVLLRLVTSNALAHVLQTTYSHLVDSPPLSAWALRLQDAPDMWIRVLKEFKYLVPSRKDYDKVYEVFDDLWRGQHVEPVPKKEDMEVLLRVLSRAKAKAIKMRM